MNLNQIALEAYNTSLHKGRHDAYRDAVGRANKIDIKAINNMFIAQQIALIHSEASEALEALRENDFKALGTELADIILTTLVLANYSEIDIERCVIDKMTANLSRPHKHNKQF